MNMQAMLLVDRISHKLNTTDPGRIALGIEDWLSTESYGWLDSIGIHTLSDIRKYLGVNMNENYVTGTDAVRDDSNRNGRHD